MENGTVAGGGILVAMQKEQQSKEAQQNGLST